MESLEELRELRDELKDLGFCNLTVDAVVAKLFSDKVTDERYLFEDWEDSGTETPYHLYVADEVLNQLDKERIVLLELRNASGNDATLIHTFAVFKIRHEYYRLESYGKTFYISKAGRMVKKYESLYCTRIVEWPTLHKDLERLLKISDPIIRLAFWNGLFSAEETSDNGDTLDVVLIEIMKK